MNRERLKNLPSAFVIAAFVVLGALLPGIFLALLPLWHQEPPIPLPGQTMHAEAIVGIHLPTFFQADPVIRASDGKLYTYRPGGHYREVDAVPDKGLRKQTCVHHMLTS
ncbi:MAG: hypothetical protein Q4G39_08665 [Brachymonas sp.]|nr:hypothetical protein [Brachymonas sp.]